MRHHRVIERHAGHRGVAAVEMALELTGVPHGKGGINAAMDYLVAAE